MTPGKAIEPAYAVAMPAPQGGSLPTGMEWAALERMADTLANSSLVPYKLKGKPGDIAVILLAAREYGVPPLMALAKLPVVNGTPAPMGELMVALILRAGHRINASVRNPDGTVYTSGEFTPAHYGKATSRRQGDDEDDVVTFSVEEATTAGLVRLKDGKPYARDDKNRPQPWELYTPNMLKWRAVANAARLRFPDVLLGLSYLPEELGATVDADGAPVMGTVEDSPRRATAATIEQRSAQEAADKLGEQVWPANVLDAVLAHAVENGYADEVVTHTTADGTETVPLRDAITADRARLDDVLPGTVGPDELETAALDYLNRLAEQTEWDADTLDEVLLRAESGRFADITATRTRDGVEYVDTVRLAVDRIRAAAAQNGAQGEPTPETEPIPPAEEPQQPQAANKARPLEIELALSALEESDSDTLRALWNTAKANDLLGVDILGAMGDDDLEAMGAPPEVQGIALGALLQQVNGYVKRHGYAVRSDPAPDSAGEAPPSEEPPPDAWH